MVDSRSSRLRVGVLAALAVLSALAATWFLLAYEPHSSDEQLIEQVIRRYNATLAEGYRALDMSRMRAVATQLQAEDEYIHMSSLAEGAVRLDPTLVSLEFIDISVETTSAQAETRETWDYRHYNRTDGTLLLEQRGLIYHLAWDLEKQTDGRWLVADVRAISATATVEPSTQGTAAPMIPGH